MLWKWPHKQGLLVTLASFVFVGQALGELYRVRLTCGGANVSVSGTLTNGGSPIGSFSLSCSGGGNASQFVKTPKGVKANDVEFNYNINNGQTTGSCAENFSSLPARYGIPSCTPLQGAQSPEAVDDGEIEVVEVTGLPSLTFYGLIALALLLAGTAVWMFRRRMATKGGLA